MNKRQANTVIFAIPTMLSEFAVTTPNRLLHRLSVSCSMKFRAQVLFAGRLITISCRRMTCADASIGKELLYLHAWMPSTQVWPTFESPASPHFWNQAPPRAQQLRLPDLFAVPHLEQLSLLITDTLVVVVGSVNMQALS